MKIRLEVNPLPLEIKEYHKKVLETSEKWQRIQQRSLTTVNTIMGLVSKLVLATNKSLYGKDISRFDQIDERLTAKLVEHIGRKIPELRRSLDLFSSIVKELDEIRKQLVLNLKDIGRFYFEPESEDWRLVEQAEEFTNEIFEMYSTELQVRMAIVKEMSGKPLKPPVYSLLMTIWAAEPYLELGRLEDILEEIIFLEENLNSKIQEPGTGTTAANPL